MTGSMYAAVSGLKAHMSALNVIGNNVANVNTLGYKTTRYTFNEALYTTQISGSDGSDSSGGRNPAQVGFGASIGTIDLDMSTKNYSPTGHALDTMIDGDGFFMVGDKMTSAGQYGLPADSSDALTNMNLTRLGNFEIDPNGYLVDGNGSVVWGFLEVPAAASYNSKNLTDMTKEDVEALAKQKNNPVRLNNVQYDTDGKVMSATVTSNILTAIRLPQVDGATTKFPIPAGEDGLAVAAPGGEGQPGNPAAQVLDADVYENNNPAAAGDDGSTPQTSDSTSTAVSYERLQSDTTSIDSKTGALTIMANDTLITVGYIAIAKVTNPNGVTHVDGRYYQAQKGAGTIRVTAVGDALKTIGIESAGDTGLLTGGLESSGTDLATEITNMITVQRGYQANTRIITVTDSMLEELVNMKR